MNHIKGVITKCNFEKKYDGDGIPYKDYVIIINNQQYTAQIKEQIYLDKGMTVLMGMKPNSANEIISGYCLKEGYTWGSNTGNLKKQISRFEKYDFLEGSILEKRKSTTGSIYMNRSAMSNRGSRVAYTIVLENSDFVASRDEGEYLQVGMEIAVVLDKKMPVVILDKGSNKFLGLSKPYFIIFLLAMILINGYFYYSKQTVFPNLKVTLIVVNVFLVLAFILSLLTFRATSSAKNFLLSKINAQ